VTVEFSELPLVEVPEPNLAALAAAEQARVTRGYVRQGNRHSYGVVPDDDNPN